MPVTVIEGEQRGDEGKGRYVDMLASEHDIVARFNGGPNAGHTVILADGTEFDLHGVPSGITHEHTINVIGNGTLIDPMKLPSEIDKLRSKGVSVAPDNLLISSAAHLIMPHHIEADVIREAGEQAQGSTKSGIAQTAAAKAERLGGRAELINNDPLQIYNLVRKGLIAQQRARKRYGLEPLDAKQVAEEYVENALQFGEYVTNTVRFLNVALRRGQRVLAEGAQSFWLDVDHGMYPYTSSSNPTAGGACVGLGIPPHSIERVIGVAKAVQSHVGGGPFVTEIDEPKLLKRLHGNMRARDAETGTTTGRKRRLGYIDVPSIRLAQMVNGTYEGALTKLDWVPRFGDELKVCVAHVRKGKVLKDAPDAAYKLDECSPAFVTLPNWQEDIGDVREFGDLPENAQKLVKFVEDLTGVRYRYIGVGPQRDQVIER